MRRFGKWSLVATYSEVSDSWDVNGSNITSPRMPTRDRIAVQAKAGDLPTALDDALGQIMMADADARVSLECDADVLWNITVGSAMRSAR